MRHSGLPGALLAVFFCAAGMAGAQGTNDQQAVQQRAAGAAYTLTTSRESYFKLNEQGLELHDGRPYRSEKTYRFQRTIRPGATAIVVMDPWVDMASEHLNKYYIKIAESRILPLVRHALELGHPVIVLTNNPETVQYNTNVHPELVKRAGDGEIAILYHQDLDDREFASYLRTRGINSLIYTGFASNMCVIGRQMGMIPMVHQGFRLFFVPQASAAVELPDTWQNQSVHHATTKIISQWIAEIVDYDEFISTRLSPAPSSSPREPGN